MKKVLSWVLSLALVLGSFSMAFAGDTLNSSKMSDADTINNVQAVDVMIDSNIIGGYPDGSFKPEKDVTRAEMAKMISVAKNGGEDVGDYYKSSCTFADSVNHWAAGYIGYCSNQGIIDGRSESVFDPNATVTGTEAAKMMLIALGYDSKIEGYTGSQWAAKVLKDAKDNGLFDGCDNFKSDAALNRDNAAQIIFNGLNAVTVAYEYDAEIKVGDTVVSVNTKAKKVEATDSKDKSGYVELYEEAFDGDLVKSETQDDFGRNSTKWTLNDEEIGTYADEADFSFVVEDTPYDKALKAYDEDFFEDYGDEWVVNDVYYNGERVVVDDVVKNAAKIKDGIALGDVAEFYDVTDDYAGTRSVGTKDVYDVVISHYEMAKISKVKDPTSSEARKGASAKLTIFTLAGKTIDSVLDTKLEGYNSSEYVKDAVIAVALDENGAIIDSFVPEMKNGEVTKTATDNYVTVDGTKIEAAGTTAAFTAYDSSAKASIVKDTEYDLYLVNGYLIGGVYADPEDYNYGVVTKTPRITVDEEAGDYDYQVTIINADGEEETIDVASKYETDFLKERGTLKDKVIEYTLNSKGELTNINLHISSSDAASALVTKTSKYTKFNSVNLEEDVIVFADINEATSVSDRDINVLGLDDLEENEQYAASYLIKDSKIVAMYVTEGLGDVETVYAVADNGANDDGTVTVMVNGEEESYYFEDEDATDYSKVMNAGLYLIKLDSEGYIKSIKQLSAGDMMNKSELQDKFDVNKFGNYYSITLDNDEDTAVSGSILNDSDDYDISDAIDNSNIYYINSDNELTSTDDITSIDGYLGASVTLIQTVKGSESWNMVFVSCN